MLLALLPDCRLQTRGTTLDMAVPAGDAPTSCWRRAWGNHVLPALPRCRACLVFGVAGTRHVVLNRMLRHA